MNDRWRYELAEAEIERLELVVKLQQKQIERLIDARDAEIILRKKLEGNLKPNQHGQKEEET